MLNLVAEAIVSKGIVEHREMTDDELAKDEANRISNLEKQTIELAEKKAKAAQKAALLEKLGITEEEAKLLLS